MTNDHVNEVSCPILVVAFCGGGIHRRSSRFLNTESEGGTLSLSYFPRTKADRTKNPMSYFDIHRGFNEKFRDYRCSVYLEDTSNLALYLPRKLRVVPLRIRLIWTNYGIRLQRSRKRMPALPKHEQTEKLKYTRWKSVQIPVHYLSNEDSGGTFEGLVPTSSTGRPLYSRGAVLYTQKDRNRFANGIVVQGYGKTLCETYSRIDRLKK
jgi:hypothetical protein